MLGHDVLTAARNRIAWTFDTFPRIYCSFSGGKDSTVMTHLVCEEARRRNRTIGLLFVDLEAQYKLTIEHVREMFALYADVIEPYWISLPLALRNAVSQFEPRWQCWEESARESWVRKPDKLSITDIGHFPFFRVNMEFEEFVVDFGEWYACGDYCACFVGIRTAESLNRWRTITRAKADFQGKCYSTIVASGLVNIYPIYDWQTKDIWVYHGKTREPYNKLYDVMYRAGLTIHQMRICQPYGDDQRKGLWLYQIIEPETWGRVVARVNGANAGALYAQESGNILGRLKITKPPNHTWESFAKLLLETLPSQTRNHYENKIAVFLRWWYARGYAEIPDEASAEEEANKTSPSWRRVCKALLRHDYWCKGLSFSQTKSESYQRYEKIMKNRRKKWGIFA